MIQKDGRRVVMKVRLKRQDGYSTERVNPWDITSCVKDVSQTMKTNSRREHVPMDAPTERQEQCHTQRALHVGTLRGTRVFPRVTA